MNGRELRRLPHMLSRSKSIADRSDRPPDADTFDPRGIFNSTPDRQENGEGGGIWQGGAGLAADDAGSIYFNTGNGPGLGGDRLLKLVSDLYSRNHGNSIVKLAPTRRSGEYDFDITAFSAAADDYEHVVAWEGDITRIPDPASVGGVFIAGHDIDLGGGGVTVIPNTPQLVGGGKTGVLYLIDRTTMNSLQALPAFDNTYDPCSKPEPNTCSRYGNWQSGPHLHGAPTYWRVSPEKGYVFHWSEKDYLKRFEYNPLSNPPSLAISKVANTPTDEKAGGGYADREQSLRSLENG